MNYEQSEILHLQIELRRANEKIRDLEARLTIEEDRHRKTKYERDEYKGRMARSYDAYVTDPHEGYLPKLPKTIQGEWRIVCYVNVKEAGKVYFNLIKIEPIAVPHGDLSSKPAAPKTTAQEFADDYGLTTDDAPAS